MPAAKPFSFDEAIKQSRDNKDDALKDAVGNAGAVLSDILDAALDGHADKGFVTRVLQQFTTMVESGDAGPLTGMVRLLQRNGVAPAALQQSTPAAPSPGSNASQEDNSQELQEAQEKIQDLENRLTDLQTHYEEVVSALGIRPEREHGRINNLDEYTARANEAVDKLREDVKKANTAKEKAESEKAAAERERNSANTAKSAAEQELANIRKDDGELGQAKKAVKDAESESSRQKSRADNAEGKLKYATRVVENTATGRGHMRPEEQESILDALKNGDPDTTPKPRPPLTKP